MAHRTQAHAIAMTGRFRSPPPSTWVTAEAPDTITHIQRTAHITRTPALDARMVVAVAAAEATEFAVT